MAITRDQLASLLSFKEPKSRLVGRRLDERDDYVLERLQFDFEGAGMVRGLLTRPTGATGKAPAILYLQPRVGHQETPEMRDLVMQFFAREL